MFDLCFGVSNQVFDHTDLIEINQQDPQIVQKVNDIMSKNRYFTCAKLNKKKRKRIQDMDLLVDVDFKKNEIYIYSLVLATACI